MVNETDPHVLVVVDPDSGDWEIEHPETCPLVCDWWPGADKANRVFPVERHTCYVAFEIAHNGLDSLTVVSHRERDGDGWRDVAPVDLNDPESPFEAEWRRLRPGRYLIEGWWTPQGWAGTEPVDADGGLTLIGPTP